MIKSLFAFLLLLASGSALADYPASLLSAMFNNSGGSYKTFPTADQACNWDTLPESLSKRVFTLTGADNDVRSYVCTGYYKDGTSVIYTKDIRFNCPNGDALKSVDGYVYLCPGDLPPPPPCTPNGPFEQNFIYPPSVNEQTDFTRINLPRVVAGCVIKIKSITKCEVVVTSSFAERVGRVVCKFMVERTGEEDLGNPAAGAPSAVGGFGADEKTAPSMLPPSKADSSGSCPKGAVQGGVDSRGIVICIGNGTAPKNPPPVAPPKIEKPPATVTNEDGSTTTTKETVTTNSDGSTTTTKEIVTTAPDGTVTRGGTSDTGTTPGGSAGQSDEAKDAEKNDLCKANPTLSVCRNSSVSGTCGEISCEGDAIQCATLRAAAAMQCQQVEDLKDLKGSPLVGIGSAVLAGNDPSKGAIETMLAGTTADLSNPNLDQSGFVGGGSCLSPKTFTVVGKSVTLSFDTVCTNIQPLRGVILTCAFIVAYLLVSRSVLQS